MAEHLQVHENTIYEWLDQGDIFPHAFKIKKGWRIPQNDVEQAKRRQFEPRTPSSNGSRSKISRTSSGFIKNWYR